MTNAYNPHGVTWMESSAAGCLEQETVEWLCRQAGYPKTAGGLFVSGGSIANLTALAAARHAMLAETEYSSGVVYLSEQAHFSVIKALRIMGLTGEQIHMIPCDDSLRMDAFQLEQAILQDEKAGKKPFMVVATAGTTNTGCIDPLSQIAGICSSHGLWFHVDGAYGASALVSEKYRHLPEAVAQADSLVWDAHKWLFQTYARSTVLFRDRKYLAAFYSSDPTDGVHGSEHAGMGDRNACAAGHCEFSLCATGDLSGAAGRTQHGDFSTHDGGRLCLRTDHPIEGPNRSADMLDPSGDNGGRYPLYDTAHGQIYPYTERGTCAKLFRNDQCLTGL